MQTEIRSQLLLEGRVTRKLEATALNRSRRLKALTDSAGVSFLPPTRAKHALGGGRQ
jgi:hypothetical protein